MLLKAIYVNVRTDTSVVLPLLVIGACGTAGMVVDFFDIYRALFGGPKWLNQIDVLVAVTLTLVVGLVDTYHRRRN